MGRIYLSGPERVKPINSTLFAENYVNILSVQLGSMQIHAKSTVKYPKNQLKVGIDYIYFFIQASHFRIKIKRQT